jgi:abortive infection bacteriophage resistance protein
MASPSKLSPDITKRIGENIAFGLTYSLAAKAAGITYQTFNEWHKKGKNSKSGEYLEFYKFIQKCNADAAKKLLEHLNESGKAGNCQVCMWILERRFSEDFGRREYRKKNVVSENMNQNVELIINDADGIRKEILAKFDRVKESNESLTS